MKLQNFRFCGFFCLIIFSIKDLSKFGIMKNLLFIAILILFSCTKENNVMTKSTKNSVDLKVSEQVKIGIDKDSILSNDIDFINDSILKGILELDISKYEIENKRNNCNPIMLSKKNIDEFYNQGFNKLGDLNGDGKIDSVFVLHALNYCEDGDSYYFTDNRIPRIKTESNCCHPESIFSIGDIDQDGGNEIAQYYSSCASAFKTINIWTLKNRKWKLVSNFIFHSINGKYEAFKDFHRLYKKIAKGKFKFLEISDMKANGKPIMEWKTITMK